MKQPIWVIVSDRGETWDGYWFRKPFRATAGCFRPFPMVEGQEYWIFPPYQYQSRRAAERRAASIPTVHRVAVVEVA